MAKTALITGASSGLGAEFARQLASKGADVVLVARDRAALDAVAERLNAEFGVATEVLVADLTTDEGTDAVASRLSDPTRPVEVLVNNAGIGLDLDFAKNDISVEERHLDLHVRATMRLSHAALQPMLPRGHGRIINVASVAAFLPRGTYGAVKAWIVSFSRWANAVYRPRGVTVTAVCPGFVDSDISATTEHVGVDAETAAALREHQIAAYHRRGYPPSKVAAQLVAAATAGDALAVVTPEAKLMRAISRFAPGLGRRIARVDLNRF